MVIHDDKKEKKIMEDPRALNLLLFEELSQNDRPRAPVLKLRARARDGKVGLY